MLSYYAMLSRVSTISEYANGVQDQSIFFNSMGEMKTRMYKTAIGLFSDNLDYWQLLNKDLIPSTRNCPVAQQQKLK